MITILCSPKPFLNEADWNQINALRSWRAIHSEIEIFVFGAASGASEASAVVNAKYVPEIECSASGAPSFNAMTAYSAHHGRYDLQVYVNCDIIMNATLVESMQSAYSHFENFLLVGERLDLAKAICIDTREIDWVSNLEHLAKMGQLTTHGPTGADYFGFVRGLWNELPPVFMGRAMCDSALLHYSLMRRIPIIDASLAILAIHQYHDYKHIRGGHIEVFNGDDRVMMAKSHGLYHSLPTVEDANWRFGIGGDIEPNNSSGRFFRRIELALRYRYKTEWAAVCMRLLQRLGGEKVLASHKRSAKSILLALQDKYIKSNI